MVEEVSRTEKILAQLLIIALNDAPLGEKAFVLSQAGFEPSEIATLLSVSSGSVRQQLYTRRKSVGKKRRLKK